MATETYSGELFGDGGYNIGDRLSGHLQVLGSPCLAAPTAGISTKGQAKSITVSPQVLDQLFPLL